ncbi:unnamed protein product, partial [Owenia fusiformis]
GFALNDDGHNCTDVNECDTANGGCTQICSNNVGSFVCSCLDGFSLQDGNACIYQKLTLAGEGGRDIILGVYELQEERNDGRVVYKYDVFYLYYLISFGDWNIATNLGSTSVHGYFTDEVPQTQYPEDLQSHMEVSDGYGFVDSTYVITPYTGDAGP